MPKNLDFSVFPKWSGRNPRRNQNLGVGGFHPPESVSTVAIRPPPPSWNFVATPLEISQYNDMDGVWDTSKYHPKLTVSIFKVKITRSRKGQTENFGFGRRDTCCWVSFSSRTQNMTPEHFWNGPNRTNFEIGKIQKPKETAWKWPFSTSKQQNSVIFQDICLTFRTHIHLAEFLHIYSVFLKIRKIPIFSDNIFLFIIFQNLKM